jgi:replicative DNA helicase
MSESIEIRVLAAAMAEPGLWLAQAARINPDLFPNQKKLATEICAMRDAGKETDPRSVYTWLADRGAPIKLSDLMSMADQSPLSIDSMTQAVDALHENAKRVAVRQLGNWLTKQAREPGARADDILRQAIGALSDISARSSAGPEEFNMILQRVMNGIGKPPTDVVKTGISTIDAITGGFRGGQMIVVGARPSMGKTSLAMGFIRQAAAAGKTVALFSLEMSADQVCHRILADLSQINLARISTHHLSGNEIRALTNAANVAHRYKIFITETAVGIDGVCRQLKHQGGLDLVVVDYLQLMDCRAESREQQISTMSRNLKRLARDLAVPVVVLSQLNRQIEQRANKRPQLSDLRESGAIEQDADIVLLLWRPGYYDTEADQTEAELIVGKHRNGPTGLVELGWQADCARFVDKDK